MDNVWSSKPFYSKYMYTFVYQIRNSHSLLMQLSIYNQKRAIGMHCSKFKSNKYFQLTCSTNKEHLPPATNSRPSCVAAKLLKCCTISPITPTWYLYSSVSVSQPWIVSSLKMVRMVLESGRKNTWAQHKNINTKQTVR